MAGLPLDRFGNACLLLGCGDGLVVSNGLLLQTGLFVVWADPFLRARTVGSGPNPQLQVVRAGLYGGRFGGSGGSEQESHRWFELGHLRQGQMLPNLCVDVADFYTHHSNGTSVEVSKNVF